MQTKKQKTKKFQSQNQSRTNSVGEQSSDLLWRLQDLLHGFVRILPAVLVDGRSDPEELRWVPLRLLPSSGHQSGATDAIRRLARTSRRVVRTRQKRRPYVVSKKKNKKKTKKQKNKNPKISSQQNFIKFHFTFSRVEIVYFLKKNSCLFF